MGLSGDLAAEVATIFKAQWSVRDGDKVPESEDLKLGNDAVKLEGAVLYADMADSTELVDSHQPHFAAEVYKSFLHCAAKLIRSEGGVVTAYDGDRIMGVYIGDSKRTNAAKTALRINWAVLDVINPAIKAQYQTTFVLKHVTAVDVSSLFIARTGVRGANDLVWVGRAANHAAKMASLSHDFASRISADVYDTMNKSSKTSQDGRSMWEAATWNNKTIYRSNWKWSQ